MVLVACVGILKTFMSACEIQENLIIYLCIFMTVTLDYKALIMLIKRKTEENESDDEGDGLCQRGLDTECCVFCKVIRVNYHRSSQ